MYTLLFQINISELEFDHFASDVIRAMIRFEQKKKNGSQTSSEFVLRRTDQNGISR
jgi:hypothetical protein